MLKQEVIVTGGAGYIGSHTVVELIAAGYTPIILDDFRNAQTWILNRIAEITGYAPTHYAVDCQDEDAVKQVFEKHKKAIGVIHFAAYKAVGESVQEPVMYYQNNVGSLCVIINAMKLYNMNNLVFSSSCTVYGDSKLPIVDEQTATLPATSPYGDTKITCEKIIQFEQKATPNFKATLLRYFNPIGAHPSALIGELPQGIPNNLVPYITQTAKGIREKLTVFGADYDTPDGTNIRDYIHVVDLAKAHVKALLYSFNQPEGFCEVFNLGTGKGTSVLEIITAFETVNDLKLKYEIGARRKGDVPQIYANPKKANELLNWTCEYTIDDALKHAWTWEKGIELMT